MEKIKIVDDMYYINKYSFIANAYSNKKNMMIDIYNAAKENIISIELIYGMENINCGKHSITIQTYYFADETKKQQNFIINYLLNIINDRTAGVGWKEQ